MNIDFLKTENEIVRVLKDIYDPEIPVNIYDLGLIYKIDVADSHNLTITMTLTAPNCPVADELVNEVKQQLNKIEGISKLDLILTFDPPWDKEMMSENAKFELGYL